MKTVEQQLIELIKGEIGQATPVVLTIPPTVEMGDFSWPLFELAKSKQTNPAALAKELAAALAPEVSRSTILRSVQPAGPYLNFFVEPSLLVRQALETRYKPAKGKGKIILETFQANPLKLFHIGHLRNAVTGESIRRLLTYAGHNVIPYSFSGDVGIHVAHWLWYFQKFYHGDIPKKEFTKWSGEIYTKAVNKAKENPEYELQVREVNKLLDARDQSIVPLWRRMVSRSYTDFKHIARELDCRVGKGFRESVCEAPGKKFIEQKIKAGKIRQDDGAWGIDLDQWQLGFLILLKSDGTALYQTKDVGLASLRHKVFGNYPLGLLVVGSEQEFYFRQLLKTFEVLEHPDAGRCRHIVHGLVSLKEGKMSSREGNIISYDELRDKTIAKVLSAIEEKNPGLQHKSAVAKKIALGALKFSMLATDRLKNVIFDWSGALSFEGNSGPYLQYTYARIRAIEKKAQSSKLKAQKKFDYNLLTNIEEARLVRVMNGFGASIERAAHEYQPYVVAQYLLQLAGEFNHFYHQCRVVDTEHVAMSRARLVLINKVAEILRVGLGLLGVGIVEEM